MFDNLSGKFGKLDIPGSSLIKKMERIKENLQKMLDLKGAQL